jgi:molybdenum cofactor cytidylyltransferase
MISALLLCAGESRRMGRPKALLTMDGRTFIRRAIATLRLALVDEIICVTGAHREEIEREIKNCALPVTCAGGKTVRAVWNPRFETGIMSSIQEGVRAIGPGTHAFFISFADLPFLLPLDFDALLGGFDTRRARLVRHRFQGIPAHPVLIASSYADEILAQPPGDSGCSFLFHKYASDACYLEADSPRGILDVDTPEDYSAHVTA